MNDIAPRFGGGMLGAMLAEIDLECNGYDHALGPCPGKKKWVVGGDTQVFISVDNLPSNYRDANDLFDEEDDLEGTIDEDCFAIGVDRNNYFDKYALMAYRCRQSSPDHDGMVTMLGLSYDERPEVIEELATKFDRETLDRWDREAERVIDILIETASVVDEDADLLPTSIGSRRSARFEYGVFYRTANDGRRGMSHGKYNRKREPKREYRRTFIAA